MTQQPHPTPSTDQPGLASFDKLAAGLAVIWLVTVVAQFFLAPESILTGPLSFLIMVLVVLLPLALLWGIVATARTIRSLRAEAGQLRIAVDQMQQSYAGLPQNPNAKPMLEQKLDEIAAAQRKTESALAMFTSRRDTALTVPSADRKAALTMPVKTQSDEQAALALGTPAEDLRAPLSVGDFVRALHFPESAEDKAGFRALRLALEDRKTSRLIRAAQDVLTLLSQEGIYMDDLKPERCRPEVWRRFASGERGRGIASLGGIRDRSSLALSSARMREDPIFRDAAHHFLRSFDKTFAEFEQNATDSELADLAETRTARAFMLLGRVTGTFD
ncbi:hypothetical protein [Pseudorhodobacter aquimaris]|uniref:hypothetical protein n=1 Tax=Pseudorhodobacter aquimaris TaxID=687412 RepID=UPI00067B71D2|nr:hypothetical protein [Pseudorhodobacter aquimaris]